MFEVVIVVADIGDLQGILGMSFFNQEECVIDVKRGLLSVGNTEIVLQRQKGDTCCQVYLSDDYMIESNTERVMRVNLIGTTFSSPVAMVQGTESFVDKTGVLVPNAVVSTEHQMTITGVNLHDKNVEILGIDRQPIAA